jgi:hypothetical protein
MSKRRPAEWDGLPRFNLARARTALIDADALFEDGHLIGAVGPRRGARAAPTHPPQAIEARPTLVPLPPKAAPQHAHLGLPMETLGLGPQSSPAALQATSAPGTLTAWSGCDRGPQRGLPYAADTCCNLDASAARVIGSG